MDWLRSRPIAHRGLHSDAVPENSLPAFEAAVEAGYPAELDVRLTADGVAVVFHDRTLDRLTAGSGRIDRTDWRDLADRTLPGETRIPRLEGVLELVDGQVPLLVELKNEGRPGALEATVADTLASYDGTFAIQSFNPLTVAWFRRRHPDWPRGQLAGLAADGAGRLRRATLNRLLPNVYTRPDFVGYNHARLPAPPVERSRDRGRVVLAWTVRSGREYEQVGPFVDNVIFERIRP